MAVEYFPFPQGVGKDVYHYNQDNLASGAESFYMGKPIKPEHRSYLTWPERYLGTATDTLLERVLVKRYADPTSVSPINLENISPKFTVAWNDRYPNQRAGDMMIMGCLKIANVAADWAINRFGKESYYLPQLSINLSTDQLTRLEKTFKDDSIGGLVCTMVNPRTKEFFSSIDEFAYEVITNPQFLFDSSVFDRDSEFKAEIEQKGLRVPPQLRIKKIIDLLRSVNYIDLESKPTQRLLMFVVDLSTQEFLDAYKINANKAMFDPATIKAKSGSVRVLVTEGGETLPCRQTVSVQPGKTSSVTCALGPLFGQVDINSSPPRAEVYLDGKRLGKTPLVVKKVKRDQEHTLRLVLEGFQPWSHSFQLQDREKKSFNVELEP